MSDCTGCLSGSKCRRELLHRKRKVGISLRRLPRHGNPHSNTILEEKLVHKYNIIVTIKTCINYLTIAYVKICTDNKFCTFHCI